MEDARRTDRAAAGVTAAPSAGASTPRVGDVGGHVGAHVVVVGAGVVGVCIALRAAQARTERHARSTATSPATAAASATRARSAPVGRAARDARRAGERCRRCCSIPTARCTCRWATCRARCRGCSLRRVGAARARADRGAARRAPCRRGRAPRRAVRVRSACPSCSCAAATSTCIRTRRALAKDAPAWRLREQLRLSLRAARPRRHRRARAAHRPALHASALFLADQATIVNPFRYVQAIARGVRRRGGHCRAR